MSNLIKKGKLWEMNVTLFLDLHAKREKVSLVTAIYFLEPTQTNIEKIKEDFKNNLYEKIQINFSRPIPDELLEQLAKTAVKYNCSNKIEKIT